MYLTLAIDWSFLTVDVSLLSSIAVIFGATFVAFQLRQNNRLIRAAAEQATAAAVQAKLTTEQMQQNNQLANMDMIMRLYEFANTAEVQSSWLTVLNSGIETFEEFEKLPKQEQIAFYQISALFESLGVLVERGFVKAEVVQDMFLVEQAWKSSVPFVLGMRKRLGEEAGYSAFESLYRKLSAPFSHAPPAVVKGPETTEEAVQRDSRVD
jgi:hypothetical protein